MRRLALAHLATAAALAQARSISSRNSSSSSPSVPNQPSAAATRTSSSSRLRFRNHSSSSTSGDHASTLSSSSPQHKMAVEDPSPSLRGGGGSDATTPDLGVRLSAEDELTRAFNHFSGKIGGCSAEEFVSGVQQAYYSTAALIGSLAEHEATSGAGKGAPKDKKAADGLPHAYEDAQALRALLAKEYLPEKEWSAPGTPEEWAAAVHMTSASKSTSNNNNNTSSSGTPTMSRETSEVAKVAQAIASILPMSKHLAATLFSVFRMQRERKASLLSIASPGDHIVSCHMNLFADLEGPTVYVANAKQGEVELDVEDSLLRTTTTTTTTASAPSSDGRADHKASESMMQVKIPATKVVVTPVKASKANAGKGAAAADASGEKAAAATAALEEPAAVVVKVNGQVLPPIPSSALAFAILTMDVVVPPGRYAPNYEWYHRRIIGYDNEYERVATARIFASNSPMSVASMLDFITRMITGKSVEFMFSPTMAKLLGLPGDIADRPPATRKMMCMYMDKSRRWVLSDLVPLAPVLAAPRPSKN